MAGQSASQQVKFSSSKRVKSVPETDLQVNILLSSDVVASTACSSKKLVHQRAKKSGYAVITFPRKFAASLRAKLPSGK